MACCILTIRLWFGSFSLYGLFTGAPIASPVGINPWDEDAAPLIISSASLTIETNSGSRIIYNNLDTNPAWILANYAIGQLIESGQFLHEIPNPAPSDSSLTIHYNFPMPSSFFREFFGTRPGFLSSHFENFNSLSITPIENTLHFAFAKATSQSYFVFVLDSPFQYDRLNELFEQETAVYPALHGPFMSTNPIGQLQLSTVADFIEFFFPNPAAITSSMINNIYTYRDNMRTVRFFYDNTVEFTIMPRPGTAGDDLTRAMLAAFSKIYEDAAHQARRGAPKNEVVLTAHNFNPETNRWHFYFKYVLNDIIVDLPAHPLEIQTLGGNVVFYRRLMLNFRAFEWEGF